MPVLSHRSARSESDRERTRDAVLSATVALLAEGPAFADVTIGQISAAADVSRPPFYAYFRDKRELGLALGATVERAAQAASADWMALRDDSVRAALEAVFAVFRDQRHTLRAVTEAAGYDSA